MSFTRLPAARVLAASASALSLAVAAQVHAQEAAEETGGGIGEVAFLHAGDLGVVFDDQQVDGRGGHGRRPEPGWARLGRQGMPPFPPGTEWMPARPGA